jgi:hypothetical protein
VDDLLGDWFRSGGFAGCAAFVVQVQCGSGFPEMLFTDDLNGANGLRFEGGNGLVGLSRSVSAAGDCYGDEFADLVVSAPSPVDDLLQNGGAYLISCEDQTAPAPPPDPSDPAGRRVPDRKAIVQSNNPFDGAGTAVAGVDDLNADSLNDFVFGEPNGDFGGALPQTEEQFNNGAVVVLFDGAEHAEAGCAWFRTRQGSCPNTTSGSTARQAKRIDGERPFDLLGSAVAIIGDVNGDGIDDFSLAAPQAMDPHGLFPVQVAGASGNGAVYVIYGRAGGPGGDLAALSVGTGFRIDGVEGEAGTFGADVATRATLTATVWRTSRSRRVPRAARSPKNPASSIAFPPTNVRRR